MSDYFLFIIESLKGNRRRVALTVAMIAVGVASLVAIQTAVDVLSERIAGSFGQMGAGLYALQARQGERPLDARTAEAFVSALGVEGVGVHSVRGTREVAKGGGKATDPVVRLVSVNDGYLASQEAPLSCGRNFSSMELSRRDGVAIIGDQVRHKLFGDGSGLGEMVSIQGRRYRIVGVLERQGAVFSTGLDGSVLVPLTGVEQDCTVSMRLSDDVKNGAMVKASTVMRNIRRLPPGAEPDFEFVEADSAESALASLRAKLSLVALAIGMVTMLGAAVGLMNSMLVSVKERRREIGVQRALGARKAVVERMFLGEALATGVLGSAAGILLGLVLGNLVAVALDGGFTVPWGWLAAAVMLASAVSLASGLLPARRAAALDPIEALRSL